MSFDGQREEAWNRSEVMPAERSIRALLNSVNTLFGACRRVLLLFSGPPRALVNR